jgi:hypothetical protein
MRQRPDIECCRNNGTVAIRPTEHGRLAKLVKRTSDGEQKVWIFHDVTKFHDDDGDQLFDHIRRGVSVGDLEAAEKFVDMCKYDLHLCVQNVGFFVPCSNAQQRYGKFDDVDRTPFADYRQAELKVVRIDLPTKEQLIELLEVEAEKR